jgi:hypothetical protein
MIKYEINHLKLILVFSLSNLFAIHTLPGQDYCNYEANKNGKKIYMQAMDALSKNQKNVTSLLIRAIDADTSYTDAYYQLALIFYEKAISSQYDVILASHQNYYFNKAEGYFLRTYALCPHFKNGSVMFYLGEMYFVLKRYNLSKYYLQIYLGDPEAEESGIVKAKEYFDMCQQWMQWIDDPEKNKIMQVEGVNTPGDERFPSISGDGQLMSFSRRYQRMKINSIYYELVDELMIARLLNIDKNGSRYYETIDAVDIPLPSNTEIVGQSFAPDKKSLIVSLLHHPTDSTPRNYQLYQITRNNDTWNLFTAIIDKENPTSDHLYGSITSNGKYIYYSANYNNGTGGTTFTKHHWTLMVTYIISTTLDLKLIP